MNLKDAAPGVWAAVKAEIEGSLSKDFSDAQFFGNPVYYARRAEKAVVALDRVVRTRGFSARLVEGEYEVLFGCMAQSGDDETGQAKAEEMAYWLSELFFGDVSLGGKARDYRVDSIALDYPPPFPVAEGSQPDRGPEHWVGVTLVWSFTFSRP